MKGFPSFPVESRTASFGVRELKIDSKKKLLTIPGTAGNKALGIEKTKPITIKYFEKDTPFEESFFNAHRSQITFRYDGKDWWCSLLILSEFLPKKYDVPQTVDEKYSLGIDIGIKKAITCSNGIVITSVTEDEKLTEYFIKERKLQKLMSNNMQRMKDRPSGWYQTPWGKNKVKKSQRYLNYKKAHDKIMVKIERRKQFLWENLSANFPWSDIKRVVVEDINKTTWFKNKKWASKLQRSAVSSLLTYIINQAEKRGIEVVKANKMYPSTQLCSNCGYQETSIKGHLEKRTFVCSKCGHTMDRDLNAAINLANYDENEFKKLDKEK